MADEITNAAAGGAQSPKLNVENLEDRIPSPSIHNAEGANLNVAHMSPEDRTRVEKRLKRKLDARCGLFVLIYIMNYLDRNNIAAARLKGLQDDLHLTDHQYETCLSILYVGYILMQIPSNMFIVSTEIRRAIKPGMSSLTHHVHRIAYPGRHCT